MTDGGVEESRQGSRLHVFITAQWSVEAELHTARFGVSHSTLILLSESRQFSFAAV